MMAPAGNNFLDHITHVDIGKVWRLRQMEYTIYWKTFLLFKIVCVHPYIEKIEIFPLDLKNNTWHNAIILMIFLKI